MLFIGIPTYNEATTIGVLLWRLRTVLSDVSREYEVVVYDDASTDDTADVLAPYARVLPLTLLRGTRRLGTGGAVDAIVRHVARTTRYPRRDGLLLMQADFTDSPALVPEFLRRFEGGADLIIGERTSAGDAPIPVRRLFAASRWVLRPFVGISDVRDLTSSFRLARIAVLRDLLKANGDTPVASGDGWMAQVDFLLRAAPHARRVETIPVTPTFGVRTRETRRTAWPDAVALAKWGWSHRGQRIVAKVIARTVDMPTEISEPVEVAEPERPERSERPERPERRDRASEPTEKRGRRERGGERREREGRSEEGDEVRTEGPTDARERPARPPRSKRPAPAAPAVEPADEVVLDAERADNGETHADGVESERSSRKRRRGKRGTKRTAEAPETARHDAESVSEESGAHARLEAAAPSEDVGGDDEAAADGTPGEAREPKRRRARRGRRRRGEGRESERAEGAETERGESRDSELRESEQRGAESVERFSNAESAGTSEPEHREQVGGDREAEGDADGGSAQRRRNRRGRRGGRRRSGSAGGASNDGAGGDDSEAGGPAPADHSPIE